MIWLSRLKDKGDYTYNHSLRASVLATVFGRHLGLDEIDLISLATGVLLSDIGKTKINRKLLNKSEALTISEKIQLKSHVELGVEMLATEKNIDHSTLVIVETHHERFNGTGYPYALVGAEIPFFGQVAGLVDVFDAITSKKSYGDHMTSAQAMDWLYSQRDKLFSADLIDNFVQAIGLYPAGTIVELTDSSIGLVVSHNPEKRLRPEVFLLRDGNKKNVQASKTIDLSKRAFMSKIDRPMVNKALLPENLNLTGEKLSLALQCNKRVRKALFG
jgi:HD-GYP domain-containing protein (c-di-GMP phosphodiesterase class II)